MTTEPEQQAEKREAQMKETVKQLATEGKEAIRHVSETTKEEIKKPTTAAAVVGAVAMGAALTFGILETAVGGAAAYVTYRLLKKRREATAQ